MSENARARVLNPDFQASLGKPIETFKDILAPWEHLNPVDQIAAYECTSLSPGNNLIKTDRMGAGQSIEGRSPFMDHRVSEALAHLPLKDKMRDGVSKHYLKDYGLRHFDRDLMFRKKSMPTMPIGEWIKGPLEDWARDTLATLDSSRYNVAGAIQMFEDHKSDKANYTRELRTLLMSAQWMRQLTAA